MPEPPRPSTASERLAQAPPQSLEAGAELAAAYAKRAPNERSRRQAERVEAMLRRLAAAARRRG